MRIACIHRERLRAKTKEIKKKKKKGDNSWSMMKFWFDIGERINGGCEIYGSGDRGACCGVAMEMEMVACVGAYLR